MTRKARNRAAGNGTGHTIRRTDLKASEPTDKQLLHSAAAAAINSHNLTPAQRDFIAWREQRKQERAGDG